MPYPREKIFGPAMDESTDCANRVLEAAEFAHALVQGVLSRMTERRVAEIVGETDGLDEILVQLECAGHGAGDLCDLE